MRAVNGEIACQARHVFGLDHHTVFEEGEALGDHKVQTWRGTRVDCMHLNVTTKDQRLREPSSERDLRIAMSYATDRNEMREMLMDGFAANMQFGVYGGLPILILVKNGL